MGPNVRLNESDLSGKWVGLYIRMGGAPGNDKSFTIMQPLSRAIEPAKGGQLQIAVQKP